MAISDKQRHELFTRFEEVLGEPHAEYVMSLLPPVGWADVATKDDLAQLEARLDMKFELIGAKFDAIDGQFEQLDGKFDNFANQLRAEFQRDLRQQLVLFLTGNTVLLGLFTALG